MQFSFMPIGHVMTDANHEELRHRTALSKIVIDRKYARGLKDLEGFSHVYVLFLLHEAPKWKGNLMVHPRGRDRYQREGNLCHPVPSPSESNRAHAREAAQQER